MCIRDSRSSCCGDIAHGNPAQGCVFDVVIYTALRRALGVVVWVTPSFACPIGGGGGHFFGSRIGGAWRVLSHAPRRPCPPVCRQGQLGPRLPERSIFYRQGTLRGHTPGSANFRGEEVASADECPTAEDSTPCSLNLLKYTGSKKK